MSKPEEKRASEKKETSQEDRKVTHRQAIDILVRFHIAFKIARIYEPNNLMFQRQVKILHNAIHIVLQSEGEAYFKIRGGTLFFNRVRLKFSFTNYFIFKFILNELRKKEIGLIAFSSGLMEEDLINFITILAKKETRPQTPFEEFQNEVKESRIQNIHLEKISPFETSTREKHASKIYFLSIFHLKEIMEKERHEEKIRLNTTRRLMQSLFNHIVQNESFIHGLTNIKNYDEYTLNHSVNVCALSIALGRRLGLDRNELVDLGISAFFHDLGKLETPLEILNKPAKLSDEEMEIIERHPHQGAEKLVQSREFRNLPLRAVHVAMEHHVKEDFTGYPRYFRRKDINLFSKIVKITDYFDAITTKRIYRKKGFTREEALALMLEQSGKEFHTIILKAFVNMMGTYPVGSLVALDTVEIGIVFEINPETAFMLRPRVKLITNSEGHKVDGEIVDLTETDPLTGKYKRSIVKCLDPEKYQIRVSDYFLAQAQ